MIASGWLMVSASPLPLPAHLPGGFVVPNLTSPNALLEARTKFVHEPVSKFLIAAILLHVAAAFKHHFAIKTLSSCACCHSIMMTDAHE
jgi:cytochrome b561